MTKQSTQLSMAVLLIVSSIALACYQVYDIDDVANGVLDVYCAGIHVGRLDFRFGILFKKVYTWQRIRLHGEFEIITL